MFLDKTLIKHLHIPSRKFTIFFWKIDSLNSTYNRKRPVREDKIRITNRISIEQGPEIINNRRFRDFEMDLRPLYSYKQMKISNIKQIAYNYEKPITA